MPSTSVAASAREIRAEVAADGKAGDHDRELAVFFCALRIDLGDVPPVLVPAIALIAIACVARTATGWIVSAGLDVEARLSSLPDRPTRHHLSTGVWS